ncbi:MAG: glycosyltransferase family 4 protein [Bacteroidia bacterium]|nr:glycosyltransferase family 4 protein [Bacteroidia bacterium]
MKVIVSCSTKFHAFALAEQLQRHGMLAGLYTSYAFQRNRWFRKLAKRVDKEQIDPSNINTAIWLAIPIKLFPKFSHLWNSIFDLWVARKIKRSDADIFIGWSGMSLNAIKAAKKKGMITILERGSSHISYQKEILNKEYAKYNLPLIQNDQVERKEIIEYREVDHISIPSSFVRNSFERKEVDQAKLIQNPYGTSSHFRPVQTERNDQKFRILYLGSLMVRKGLPYMFEAVKNLSIPKEDYEVIFVGRVQEEVRLIAEAQKEDNWKFLGHMDHYSLSEVISTCDVAIHPSLEEGLSMVIPQIMSCGIPVIATTNTGGMDIIDDGKNGFIVPIRNPKAIAEKIELLQQDKDLLNSFRQSLGQNQMQYTWEAYGDRYANNLKQLHGR